jgi:tetratricopeptide (TPR) repeat protein
MVRPMGAIDFKQVMRQADRMAALEPGVTPEAEVFYAARLLEGVSKDLRHRLTGKSSENCLANLAVLQDNYGLLDKVFKELAHTLRIMGNRARHSLSEFTAADSRLARVLMYEIYLWIFRIDTAREPAAMLEKAASVTRCAPDEMKLVGLLKEVGGKERPASDLTPYLPELTQSAHFAALAASLLIAADQLDPAASVIAQARALFPRSSVRLKTLDLYCRSRKKDLEGGLKLANDDELKSQKQDGEVMGIRGGFFKRMWQAKTKWEAADKAAWDAGDKTRPPPPPANRQAAWALNESFECYKGPWEAGGKTDTYVGVNAAATAALLGKLDLAKSYAQTVVERLETADRDIAKAGLAPRLVEGEEAYYRDVTLAEAKLLAGERAVALDLYRKAFLKYEASLPGHIGGTRGQAQLIADALGLGELAF